MMSKFEIILASVPDRERLVAEVHYVNTYWAELSQENEEVMIQFYSHPTEKCWEFPLDKALEVLEKAKRELLEDYPES
jgi:hypothetical protein